MLQHYWLVFLELLVTPFRHPETIWGIVPLYFSWLVNELTSSKASYTTALQTGFTFLWAAAHWIWPYAQFRASPSVAWNHLWTINVVVTGLVIAVGLLALISGLRHKFPKRAAFLGHSRFAAYFMVAMFPIQARQLNWSWERLAAILIFAAPFWLVFDLGLRPIRNRK